MGIKLAILFSPSLIQCAAICQARSPDCNAFYVNVSAGCELVKLSTNQTLNVNYPNVHVPRKLLASGDVETGEKALILLVDTSSFQHL